MLNRDGSRLRRCVSALVLASLILLPSANCYAWGAGGHMIVAFIASQRLNARARREVNRLLAIPINPADLSRADRDFVNSAHWADDVRNRRGFARFAPEHFSDFPFSTDGTPLPPLPAADNVVVALEHNLDVLRTSTDDNARAQALRFIIHFVGDIHQPLHCSTRVDAAHREGDRGGNLFNIRVRNANGRMTRETLHHFWDAGLDSFPAGNPPTLRRITSAASVAMSGNPDTDPGLHLDNPTDFAGWAKESSDLARSDAYGQIAPGGTPTAAYRRSGTAIARRRVTWGGYRLAALLNSVFP